ncbi:hypothetical protein [Halosimplex halophilum]|uniref:hypothetical protein n=1 Tax=Halosimplex halophilum TaxID=2559572 RepID=UPI001AE5D418|nr:hypothetical protein [Halosimplex halophilum]
MDSDGVMERRQFIGSATLLGATVLSGCSDLGDSENGVQDSDGDGVIDSEDYAPNDPDVQEKSDLQSTSTPSASDGVGTLDEIGSNGAGTDSPTPSESDGVDGLDEIELDGTETDTPGENPVLVSDIRHPEPQAVAIDNTHNRGDSYDFTATVENTGTAGDIGLTLVFLEDPDDSVHSVGSKKVRSQKRFFSSGERRSTTMTAELEDGYEGYGFRLWAGEVEADIRNRGRSGDVEVQLLNEEGIGDTGVVLDEQTVDISGGETRTVLFEGEYDGFMFENVTVEASRIE